MSRTGKVIVLAAVLLFGCSKERSMIPDVPVNFSAPINDPRLSALHNAGGAVVITGYGYAGLILYNNGEQVMAYDRCSTVDPEKKCKLELDDPALTATDPCSGAKFLLSDGSAAKAPAQYPLKRYQVTVSSTTISVFN